jgi:hypothetical protein
MLSRRSRLLRRMPSLFVVAMVAVAAILVSCGGSDDGGTSPASNNAAASGNNSTVASSGVVATPAETSNDSASSAGGTADVCPFLRDLFHGSGGGPSDLPPDRMAEIFDGLADRAPAEIQEDVRVLAEGFAPVLQMLQSLGVDHASDISSLSVADQQRVQDALVALTVGDVGAASNRIDLFLVGRC